MKKFLLIAALAAVALGANAEGYKIEKVWENTDVASLYLTGVRQGFGMDGRFYINDTQWNGEGEPTIYIYGENGLEGTLPGYANTAITRDEAGNLVVMNNTAFAAHGNDIPWELGATIKVINLTTNESKEYQIPPDALISGRCDFLGFAKGNLMEDGEIYLTGGQNGAVFSIVAISGGEVDTDNSYHVTNENTLATTSTVINYYTDVEGNGTLLYVTRNAPMVKIPLDDLTGGEKLTLPTRGPSNGAFAFVFENKEFIVYPYKSASDVNYLDGFVVTEIGAEEPIAVVPATITAPINGYQNNWVNAEVDRSGVTIYHYYPGGYINVWRLTKEEEPVPPTVYILGEVNEQGWAANAGTEMTYDPENNVYTANVTLDGRGEAGENYFSFTTELANDNDDGGWAYIAPFRFGAVAEGDFWYDDMYDGQPLGLTYENGQAFRVLAGEYNLTVSLENMTLVIKKVVPPYVRGDVDGDQVVNISDVTALIDYLLSGATAPAAADCDLDQNVNISDVTALIDFLLSGHWAE